MTDLSVRMAVSADAAILLSSGDRIFDAAADPDLVAGFLADPRHHLSIAVAGETLVGMCSGVHYIHPDKPAQMWINELGVDEDWRRQGIATRLMGVMTNHAETLHCTEAWVISDPTEMALGFYQSLGWEKTGTHLAMFSFSLGD